jgi:predicted RNase H-like nuclease (RuvC/YqgF family)
MVQENTNARVDITTDDVQAVMQANPMVALQVSNRALMRKLFEVQGEVTRLTKELEQAQNGTAHKETKDANSPG